MKFDQSRSFAPIDERIARTSDPRHRAMLGALREHTAAEYARDLERVMATMVSDPIFHTYSPRGTEVLSGAEELRGFYTRFFAGQDGAFRATERIAVSDEGIWVEGPVYLRYPGKYLCEHGLEAEPQASYQQVARVGTFFPFVGDGEVVKIVGEDCYMPEMIFPPGSMQSVRKLEGDELT